MINDYYLRCQQSEITTLYAMGLSLGLVTQAVDQSGNPIAGQYVAVPPHALDVIGTKYKPTGQMTTVTQADGSTMQVPQMATVVDSTGVPYYHANLRTPIDLLAQAEASADPNVQAALKQIASWFITDPATGLAAAPAEPARVWF